MKIEVDREYTVTIKLTDDEVIEIKKQLNILTNNHALDRNTETYVLLERIVGYTLE